MTDQQWEAYQEVDARLVTSQHLTDAEIVQAVQSKGEADDLEEPEEEPEAAPSAPMTLYQAIDHLQGLKDFLAGCQGDTTDSWDLLSKLEKKVKKLARPTKQKTIHSFFTKVKPTPLAPLVESAMSLELVFGLCCF